MCFQFFKKLKFFCKGFIISCTTGNFCNSSVNNINIRKISSRLIVSMSLNGSIEPSTWMMLLFSKHLTTWTIASVSLICERNWLPSPSPFEAPFTSPAMSTNSITAGTILPNYINQIITEAFRQVLKQHRH